MPTSAPLTAFADRIRGRAWTHADVRCALDQPGAMAWVDGPALVCAWGPRTPRNAAVVHAVEERAFGPCAQLLAELRPHLPARLELRVGQAGAGVLAQSHHIDMLGPVQRFAAPDRATLDEPVGVAPLSPLHIDAIRALVGRDDPPAPAQIDPGWIGVFEGQELVAAVGPVDTGDDVCQVRPPLLARRHRKTDLGAQMLSAFVGRQRRTVFVDIRADRRSKVDLAERAGFRLTSAFERWWCVRR
ncbi:MAG: hypothetical protein AB8H79_19780 [Myxococcota bacterium]